MTIFSKKKKQKTPACFVYSNETIYVYLIRYDDPFEYPTVDESEWTHITYIIAIIIV